MKQIVLKNTLSWYLSTIQVRVGIMSSLEHFHISYLYIKLSADVVIIFFYDNFGKSYYYPIRQEIASYNYSFICHIYNKYKKQQIRHIYN